ncbi:MAG: hypothetical protein JW819_09070 [Candidatus Krumholzibacteriota bacterium]|nr:hypothetical protein [Candidatus Krumholzibacteriota bacterium]
MRHGKSRIRAVLFLAAMSSAASACAQQPFDLARQDGEDVAIGIYRRLHSDVLGEDRLLLVCLPRDYGDSSLRYPVLFVLYGDQIRGYFAEAVHVVSRLAGEGSMPDCIIVGVANVDRYRDLLPVHRDGRPGSIDAFLRFFAEELVPFIEAGYRTKDYRILIGPQAGGAFGLYALAERPGLFDACLLENPFASLPNREPLMARAEKLLAAPPAGRVFVQIACVDRQGSNDLTEAAGLALRLRDRYAQAAPPGLELVVRHDADNEDFIPPLGVKEGLRALFAGYAFPEGRVVRGLADITGHYAALSERYGFAVDVPEMTLTLAGDALARRGDLDAAEAIFHHILEIYPNSLNGHWQLANLYRRRGDRERAVYRCRRCLEIMPNMPPARRMLEELGAR